MNQIGNVPEISLNHTVILHMIKACSLIEPYWALWVVADPKLACAHFDLHLLANNLQVCPRAPLWQHRERERERKREREREITEHNSFPKNSEAIFAVSMRSKVTELFHKTVALMAVLFQGMCELCKPCFSPVARVQRPSMHAC